MDNGQRGFLGLAARTIVVHTITYTLMGMLAFTLLSYEEAFARPWMACWMRPTDDPLVTAGTLFQPIRGLIFALVFYPLREALFARKRGWLLLWWLLVGLGIFSTFGPAPGSVEGMIYTVIPISQQITGWLEVVPQALLFSVILFYWVNHPEKRWLNWLMAALFVLTLMLMAMGLLVGLLGMA
jgi:uncharacterized membrane protein